MFSSHTRFYDPFIPAWLTMASICIFCIIIHSKALYLYEADCILF